MAERTTADAVVRSSRAVMQLQRWWRSRRLRWQWHQLAKDLVGYKKLIQDVRQQTQSEPPTEDEARKLHGVAVLLASQGQLEEAAATFERAIVLKRQVFESAQHPELAVTLHELGVVRRELGQPTEAAHLLGQALIIRQVLEEQHGTESIRPWS